MENLYIKELNSEEISMKEIVNHISIKDIIINKNLWYKNKYEDEKNDKTFKIAKRPRFDFSYSLFYVPKKIVEDYNNNLKIKLIKAVLKRKLSAMVYATMRTKEKLNDGTYLHRFNTYEIIVNHKAKVILSVTLKDKLERASGDIILYKNLCKSYELDSDRIDFCCMKKYHIYGRDNMNPVNTQIRKHPNQVLWSDDVVTWHRYIDSINKDGYSIINGKRKYWLYKLNFN